MSRSPEEQAALDKKWVLLTNPAALEIDTDSINRLLETSPLEGAYRALDAAENNPCHFDACLIIDRLIPLLKPADRVDPASVAAMALASILEGNQKRKDLALKAGAVPALTVLLGSKDKTVSGNAAGAVAEFLQNSGLEITSAMVESGAIPLLMGLLSCRDEETAENAAYALVRLAETDIYRPLVEPVAQKIYNILHNDEMGLSCFKKSRLLTPVRSRL